MSGQEKPAKTGPLSGLTVIEMAGIGPVPLAALMLSELGARILRIERKQVGRSFLNLPPEYDLDRHGRDIVKVDLKDPKGIELTLRLMETADAVVEGFRPGVMERLGLGPDTVLARNPALIYARMTGFGQEGPFAQRAGHDLTYLACSGLLHAIGPKDGKPVPPLNLVADYGGGTMFLIMGLLAALFERGKSGRGQVVDAAMIDGVSMLAAPTFAYMAAGFWKDVRGSNLLDSGAPFYDTYETSDGGHVAVACLEPQFFAEFATLLPLDERFVASQHDRSCWHDMRSAIAAKFKERTRDAWGALFEHADACVAPVLSLTEAPAHPHNRARGAHARMGRMKRPVPAPRFSRSTTMVATPAGADADSATAVLARFGIDADSAERLVMDGIVSG